MRYCVLTYSHFQIVIGLELHFTRQLCLLFADGTREYILSQGVYVRNQGQILCTLETEGVNAAKFDRLGRNLDALVADEDLFHLFKIYFLKFITKSLFDHSAVQKPYFVICHSYVFLIVPGKAVISPRIGDSTRLIPGTRRRHLHLIDLPSQHVVNLLV